MNVKPPENREAGDSHGQLTLPSITPATSKIDPPVAQKRQMQYDYSGIPVEPTGRQNRFVLRLLRENPRGLTSVELVAKNIADPRPRIRDLRELGHRIHTIQAHPHTVGRYILLSDLGTESGGVK